MNTVVWVVVAIVVAAIWVTWLAGRLDRLHVRVEAARATLDAQLLRRAAVAVELAAYAGRRGLLDEPVAGALADAARAARSPDPADREGIENDLSRALRIALAALPEDDVLAGYPGAVRVLGDLASAANRVGLARSFYNGAVDDTRLFRRSWLVRWLRLAGHAPLPAYFEIDDDLPRSVPARAAG